MNINRKGFAPVAVMIALVVIIGIGVIEYYSYRRSLTPQSLIVNNATSSADQSINISLNSRTSCPTFNTWINGSPRWQIIKNCAYSEDTLVAGADVHTFAAVDYNYAKDKNHVYYHGQDFTRGDVTIVKGADPMTFVDASGTIKDENNLYDENGVAFNTTKDGTLINVPSFRTIGNDYYADKNNIYIDSDYSLKEVRVLPGLDPATFNIIGNCESVEKSGSFYVKDKNHVYCGATVIAGADPATFEYIGQYDENPGGLPLLSGIAKDKNYVYRKGEKVLNSSDEYANPTTCTTKSFSSNPLNCGIQGSVGEFQ